MKSTIDEALERAEELEDENQKLSDQLDAKILQNIALESERDELLRDKARLDFLDACNLALNKHWKTTYRWKCILSANVTRLLLPAQNGAREGIGPIDLNDSQAGNDAFDSCRLAIDEAMSKAKSP